ncbi:MAG: 16S rRNA (cytidine(1402)-2'-O)-methyltransferase [Candidatus Yanofskybacteria bacterium CG10_big_fil_rev_8_21_14_0_10_36_16]|uniref:Ribosomal RNA small subunit methyltransferase I n=1 Tax=Candidatus Yanofskybacteria bacterium CG10_big_fil_rev_8_21_14_0_10_36_16 TaxID=1975096 RepID=A0A2J0Q6Q6_9BACT|nr:MAG: 16S rRNA (cytidine(1402)-2'-O)-methyltransferase [Candidatus Yanofskybacteria bacterium CG10_big_fil_rev_8_21_14_0_10_36_16]
MNLYVVATPIGNLKDMTFRAIETLKGVDLILAEDTRVTRKLLDHYGINTPLESFHQHSDSEKINNIVEQLQKGKNVALVSDAGTPGINDPGGILVNKIIESGPEIKIIPIPGPNAAITALSISGINADKFIFLGYPPHKKGRQTFFKELSESKCPSVFYESSHRIFKALTQLSELEGTKEKHIIVARELTKKFETIYRGTASDILTKLETRGEFVVIVT